MPARADRDVRTGLLRGLARRCPNCGEGPLFRGYLKLQTTCPACGADNTGYRPDDGPAYFTVLIIGHAVVGPLLMTPIVRAWNPLATVALLLPLVAIVTLAALAFIKGAFVGLQWALGTAGPATKPVPRGVSALTAPKP